MQNIFAYDGTMSIVGESFVTLATQKHDCNQSDFLRKANFCSTK